MFCSHRSLRNIINITLAENIFRRKDQECRLNSMRRRLAWLLLDLLLYSQGYLLFCSFSNLHNFV